MKPVTIDTRKPLVVHIIDRLPPDGAERLLVDVLKHRSTEYRYIVLCLVEGGPLVKELEDMDVTVEIMGRRGRYDLGLLIRLVSWLRHHHPQVVHTHLFTADAWGRLAAYMARVPGIFSTVHSTNTWKSALHNRVDWLFSLFSTRVIACSAQVAHVLQQLQGIATNRIVTIANGVNLQRTESLSPVNLSAEFGIAPGRKTIVIAGRLHEAKGHHDLLPVFARMVSRNPELHLLIVGEGELMQDITSQVKELGIGENVTLAGFRTDVLAIIAACDIVVMPSRWEGLPMVLLEAMALGKPVVATAVGGIPNVIKDQVNGLLCEPGNQFMLENKLSQLLNDSSLCEKLAESGRKLVVEEYSASTVSRRYEELYREVINRSSRYLFIPQGAGCKGKS